MPSAASGQDIRLGTRIADLPGVGQQRAERFARLGIHVVSDLLRHLPMRYELESAESTIEDLPIEAHGSARGTIVATRWVPTARRGGKHRFEAVLEDHRERLNLVWFNAHFLRDKIHPGLLIRVHGTVKTFGGYPQMVNPKWEPLDDDAVPRKDQQLRPIYPATEDLTSSAIESVVTQALPQVADQIVDPLPAQFLRQRAMPSLAQAHRQVHQPEDDDQAKAGRRRLAYNELLLLQLGIALKRHFNLHRLIAPPLRWSPAVDRHIRDRFPFDLTEGQEQVVGEIAADLQKSYPMNRLLQGDVGAGKTVVALYALLMAVANRKQGALMAPTELLAEQHLISITDMLAGAAVRVALLTSQAAASGSSDRDALLEQIASGEADIVIGTQALLTESVHFADLAVVVVDEQHRFGVMQRAAFRAGAGQGEEGEAARIRSPHGLVMTATPIPRTLSLSVFGDLDVSTIRNLPPGRGPITTRLVGSDKTDSVYDYLAERIARGEQAYVVVPAIDPHGDESRAQLKNVREHADVLQEKLGPFKVAAIHGQLKRQTRETIMHRFRGGQIHVLVATTVIEVGVDVPNATMMVVEHADRFGLAQLHQLRGRIGRGGDGKPSVCVFISDSTSDESSRRLEAIASTNDGFEIAERDLEIRGMGDFFGTRQHGLPPLRVARIPKDMELLQMARRDAEAIVREDPNLSDGSHQVLRRILLRDYGEAIALIDVG